MVDGQEARVKNMRRLYTKRYELTRRGVAIDKATREFIAGIVAKNSTTDPIDLRDVVTQALEMSLSRHYLDAAEQLLKCKKPP